MRVALLLEEPRRGDGEGELDGKVLERAEESRRQAARRARHEPAEDPDRGAAVGDRNGDEGERRGEAREGRSPREEGRDDRVGSRRPPRRGATLPWRGARGGRPGSRWPPRRRRRGPRRPAPREARPKRGPGWRRGRGRSEGPTSSTVRRTMLTTSDRPESAAWIRETKDASLVDEPLRLEEARLFERPGRELGQLLREAKLLRRQDEPAAARHRQKAEDGVARVKRKRHPLSPDRHPGRRRLVVEDRPVRREAPQEDVVRLEGAPAAGRHGRRAVSHRSRARQLFDLARLDQEADTPGRGRTPARGRSRRRSGG